MKAMTSQSQLGGVSRQLRNLYQSDAAFSIALALLFLVLATTGVMHHEMWRDELENWLVPRDSSSLAEMFRIRRYGGHPGLWYLILYPLSRFTHSTLAVQLIHVFLASTAIFIFARFAPFSRLQKILFSFGYFPFFEYAVISRNYVLTELLLFACCAVLFRSGARPVYLAILIALLANTTIYGLMIAAAMTAPLTWQWVVRREITPETSRSKPELLVALLVVIGGMALAVLSIKQPPDAGFVSGWYLGLDARKAAIVLTTIFQAYVPVPNFFSDHFWNTNIFMRGVGSVIAAFVSAALFVYVAALLTRARSILLLYLIGTLGMLLFAYVKYYGYLRHNGNLYLLLIACLWLSSARSGPESESTGTREPHVLQFIERSRSAFITLILILHIPGGIFAWSMDLHKPFSSIKETADFIRSAGLEDSLTIGSDERYVSSITGYLEKKFYYPDSERFGTHIIFNNTTRGRSPAEILQRAREFVTRENKPVLLLLSFTLNERPIDLNVEEIKHVDAGIVEDEEYFLYRVNANN